MSVQAIRPQPVIAAEAEVLLDRWAAWMRGEGYRERTIVDCLGCIRRMAVRHENPIECQPADINDYLGRPVAQSTRAHEFTSIRAFFRFVVMTGRRVDDPTAHMRPPKIPRRVPHPITTGQLRTLLATPMYARTRTMILLAAYQGLRVHEIAKIKGADFDIENRTLRVIGKGGHAAVLPLHPTVADQMLNYPRQGYWFPTYIGNRLGEDGPIVSKSVSTVIGNAMRRAGVPGSAHSLRHWYGTELVRSGADLRSAQMLLRHANLGTTQMYVAVDPEQLSSAGLRLPDIDVTAPVPPTPAVEQSRRRAFHDKVNASPAQVRRWARENGHDVAKHGQLPWTILRAYSAAR